MKKILVADSVMTMIANENSFLNRTDIRLFTATTNDDVLAVHRAEKVNLIIAPLELPGMESELLYAAIRDNRELRMVSLLVLCPNDPSAIARGSRCGANVVMTLPANPSLLIEKAQELLDISWRESYRVLLSVSVEGNNNNKTFFCRSENISATGILIETDRVFTKGDRVTCSFFLPDSKQIKTGGEIIRILAQAKGSKANQYGIKFAPLSAEAISAIETFVEKKSQVSTSQK